MTATETERAFEPERWTCAGARLVSGKLATAWEEPETRRLIYWSEGQRQHVVGGIYELQIARTADGTFSRRGAPAYTGERITDADPVAEWEVEDQRCRRRQRLDAAERRHAKDTRLAAAVIPVQRIAAKLHDANQMEALKTYVYRAISEAYWNHEAPKEGDNDA